MLRVIRLLPLFVLLFCVVSVSAQEEEIQQEDTVSVVADSVYWSVVFDDPFAIKKAYIHILPLYGELFATNVTAGFGVHGEYYYNDLFDVHFEYRHSYSNGTDIYKGAYEKAETQIVENPSKSFNYFEAGFTYHIKDQSVTKPARIVRIASAMTPDQRAASVPQTIKVPALQRTIYGARLGGLYYTTTADINSVSRSQELTLSDTNGNPVPADVSAFSNVRALSLYVGGSATFIRNFVIRFNDSEDTSGDDLILTTYADLIIAPNVALDDMIYLGRTFPADQISTSSVGFRLGIEGKFDRVMGWSYGAELGVRPGISQRGFFIMGKISFPVFGTNFEPKYQPARFY